MRRIRKRWRTIAGGVSGLAGGAVGGVAAVASAPDGFSYYAVLRDESNGAALTIPAGGAAAPQQSYSLRDPVTVELGTHVFGSTRRAEARVVSAPWGSDEGDAGLSGGKT